MGGLEVINVVVSNTIAFSTLVVAIASWFGIGAINLIFNRRHRR